MKQNNYKKKSPPSEQIGIIGGKQQGKTKKAKKENEAQEELAPTKKKVKEVIMGMGGLVQEVIQEMTAAMKK